MSSDETLLKFPCEYPLKVMGKANLEFEATVLEILRRHVPTLGEAAVRARHSKDGTFVSLTATFTATSKAQIDAIYQELHAHDFLELLYPPFSVKMP